MGGVFSSSSDKHKGGPKLSPPREGRKKVAARAQVTSKDKAVLELKNARDKLRRYQRRLDVESDQLLQQVKQLLESGKKDRAMLVLKMKKYKEIQMKKADEQLLQVLQMVDTVEWETQQLQVFNGLKAGNEALNAIHEEMTVEDVENLMLETEEAQATEDEISQLLGSNLSVEVEDAALQELEELEKEEAAELEKQLPEAPTSAIETDDIQVSEEPFAQAPARTKKSVEKKREPIAAT